eukprot:CAMPEP_0115217650 /NCGR_PEP_ID=MMETSP0270-20121206/25977_1 /TAXON_ID=71861 /ORGANISM="Scrippsiella trochoidea, Strain CCMP3099" /LENGTH=30 /DNA_ID= /DNA_START= /DNA_END= /DNA_ORIENTATION=
MVDTEFGALDKGHPVPACATSVRLQAPKAN